jgi:hypothetical protein
MFLFSEPIVLTIDSCADFTVVPPGQVSGGSCFESKLRFDDPEPTWLLLQEAEQRSNFFATADGVNQLSGSYHHE